MWTFCSLLQEKRVSAVAKMVNLKNVINEKYCLDDCCILSSEVVVNKANWGM